MTPLPGAESWPRTVEEATGRLVEALSPAWKTRLCGTDPTGVWSIHFTLGVWVRNNFGLWRGNKELLTDCARRFHGLADDESVGPEHRVNGDKASAVILRATSEALSKGAG